MKAIILGAVSFLFVLKVSSQNSTGYTENIKKAWDLYNQKDYINSAKTYSLAFALNGGKGTQDDRYNAACSWALAGNIDSAFQYLYGAAEKNSYENIAHIIADSDLNSLHTDPRWEKLLVIVRANKAKMEANFIKPVVAILDTVYNDDQRTRKGIVELINKEGMESDTVKKRLKEMNYLDSINYIKIQKIVDEYGWLGFDKIGRNGALTLFLVIQHSPLAIQKKYLPLLREAVKNKQAIAGNLAMLEDRIALREGKKQIYGSQIATDSTGFTFLQPVEDPDHVDERRKAVGLGPLADYVKLFGIELDMDKFKKYWEKMEENEKKKKKD